MKKDKKLALEIDGQTIDRSDESSIQVNPYSKQKQK